MGAHTNLNTTCLAAIWIISPETLDVDGICGKTSTSEQTQIEPKSELATLQEERTRRQRVTRANKSEYNQRKRKRPAHQGTLSINLL